MNKSRQNWVLLSIGLLVFLVHVWFTETSIRRQGLAALERDAGLLTKAVWQLDPASVEQYLLIEVETRRYEWIGVVQPDGTLFAEKAGAAPAGSDAILNRLGLLPVVHYSVPLVHRNEVIGSVEARWRSRTVYRHLGALLAIALVLFLIERHLRVRDGSRTLELGVAERTRELRQRNEVLDALAETAGDLLRASDWRTGTERMLQRLGQVTGVSRAYLFACHADSRGRETISQRAEWVNEGVAPQIDNPMLQDLDIAEAGLAQWMNELRQGRPNIARVSELSVQDRPLLESQQIQSLAAFPIMVGGRWWGFVGFDDCVTERVWSDAEINALRAACGLLSAAIERHNAEVALVDSEERLRLALGSANQGLYDLDLRTGIATVSPEYARMLGYEPAEFEETSDRWQARLHPDDREAVTRQYLDYLAGRVATYETEFRQQTRDGGWVWILSLGRIVARNERGEPLRMLGTHTNVSRLKQAELALAESERAMRALAGSLQQARESERTLIAREVHDQIGQSLTGLNLDIAWLQRSLERDAPQTPGGREFGDRLVRMSRMVEDTVTSVQRLCADLRPGILDDLGLAAALAWQADEFRDRTGIPCSVQAPDDISFISGEQATVLYRIFQEALTNIVRHARAKQVNVILARAGELVCLDISDDGVGMAPGAGQKSTSLGLLGMRERAAAVQGEVRYESAAGRGQIVKVRLPVGP